MPLAGPGPEPPLHGGQRAMRSPGPTSAGGQGMKTGAQEVEGSWPPV